jgi:hypothetical protein
MADMVWLDDFDATVLFRLWKHREDGFGTLVRARDLRNMLGPQDPKVPSQAQVVRSLEKMKNGGLLEWEKVAVQKQSGPTPGGFRITSGNLMTRPATAVMLLEIHNDPTPPTRRSALLPALLQNGFRHKGSDITEAYVTEQISFCVAKGYLEQTASGDENDVGLETTKRVDAEHLFIDRLRRFAQVARILWSTAGKERFDRREDSQAFNEFLTGLNQLQIDAFAAWLNYSHTTFLSTGTSSQVDFKAPTSAVIERLKQSLTDFAN